MPTHGNLSNVAAKLNISDMYENFQSEKSMHVKLPKFKLHYKQDLRQALTSMGKEKKSLYLHAINELFLICKSLWIKASAK